MKDEIVTMMDELSREDFEDLCDTMMRIRLTERKLMEKVDKQEGKDIVDKMLNMIEKG